MIEIVALLLAGQVVAEDFAPTDVAVIEAPWPDPVATLYVDPTKVDEEVARAVAQAGATERIPVRAGQSLIEVIEDACGWDPPGYFELLAERGLEGVSGGISRETVFDRDMILTLPACLSRPADAPQFVVRPIALEMDSEPIKRYLKPPDGFMAYDIGLRSMTATTGSSKAAYLDVIQRLNPDLASWRGTTRIRELLLPERGFWTDLRIGPLAADGSAESVERIVATFEAAGQPREVTSPSLNTAGPMDDFQLMSELTDQRLAELGACQPGTVRDPSLEIDVSELLKVLSFGSRRAGNNAWPVTVVVPDTGVQIGEVGPFRRERIYPPDSSDNASEFRPFPRYPNHQHGTNVATLALGGVDFLEVIDGLKVDLRITPVRLLEESLDSVQVDSRLVEFYTHRLSLAGLKNAIEQAISARGVVNLSLTRNELMNDHIGKWLNPDSQVLFVAAAGNDQDDLEEECQYPACYGGRSGTGKDNVVTVAALDFDGTVAGFSNFSEQYVDLAAPGCAVPVLDYDTGSGSFEYGRASGTSFAAPQVAFTAALLRVVWPGGRPREIKRRILASATITTELWWPRDPQPESSSESTPAPRKVADGRRLDPVKALSVYQDVVEVEENGARRLIRGTADPGVDAWDSACSPGTVLVRRKTSEEGGGARAIKKIAFIPDREGRMRRLEYYTDGAGNLQKTSEEPCLAGDFTLSIREDFTGHLYTFGLDQLRDVVFAEVPMK